MSESSSNNDNKEAAATSSSSFSQKWTRTLRSFTKPFLKPILITSHHAATYPKTYIISMIVLSLGLVVLGVATNFTQDTSDEIWTPQNSRALDHGKWVADDSNFPKETRASLIIVHRDGQNLFGIDDQGDHSLAVEATRRMMQALEHFQATPRYDELCSMSDYVNPTTNQTTCQVVSASTFWETSGTPFTSEDLSDWTNEQVLQTMSEEYYPFGGKVDHDQIIGFNKFSEEEDDLLYYGKSFVTVVLLPPDKDDVDDDDDENLPFRNAFTFDFEDVMLERMQDLQEKWDAEPGNTFKLEIIAQRSFEDEFTRAVTKDLPLLPVVFVLMSVLCIALFARRDKVLSRSWMGFGAVVTVLLAIIASFGLMFLIGVPFTSLTPLLPFIIFGVGLDDAFIISGAFARTDHTKNPVERIDETMQDIGGTILLTSLTSSLAFALGAVSTIPAVRYLVMYAFPTIMIDFVFQITFFVAIIVLDQRRIEDNRRDCCFCCRAKDVSDASTQDLQGKSEKHFADRLMTGYANVLLKPAVKWAVIVVFAGMLGFFSWRTSKLTQYFDFTDVIPSDSYIQPWWDAYQDLYEANGVRAQVYFRDVDFSDKSIQDQMESYVAELAAMPYTGANEPFEFWLRDFKIFIQNENLSALSFEEQIKLFLEDPAYNDSYKDNIVLNEDGVMTASRTLIRLDNVDEENVVETVDVLETQRDISGSQPINKGKDDWAFFTFAEDYYIWEFYRVSPYELGLTTVIGTVSVSILALLFIPHWSAIFFVGPMVAVLYIDLLGFIELCGIHVNPVMYISTVMSIGLMVDFVMHVTLRYMETTSTSRVEKTKETLETIGASVFIGGFSTLIGVLPLALSTSEIFWTTFIIFFGLVLMGLLHGLVLLPVLLSMVGPRESIVEETLSNPKAFQPEETLSDIDASKQPSDV